MADNKEQWTLNDILSINPSMHSSPKDFAERQQSMQNTYNQVTPEQVAWKDYSYNLSRNPENVEWANAFNTGSKLKQLKYDHDNEMPKDRNGLQAKAMSLVKLQPDVAAQYYSQYMSYISRTTNNQVFQAQDGLWYKTGEHDFVQWSSGKDNDGSHYYASDLAASILYNCGVQDYAKACTEYIKDYYNKHQGMMYSYAMTNGMMKNLVGKEPPNFLRFDKNKNLAYQVNSLNKSKKYNLDDWNRFFTISMNNLKTDIIGNTGYFEGHDNQFANDIYALTDKLESNSTEQNLPILKNIMLLAIQNYADIAAEYTAEDVNNFFKSFEEGTLKAKSEPEYLPGTFSTGHDARVIRSYRRK